MKRAFVVIAAMALLAAPALAGAYLPPAGGWTYVYTGDAAAAGTGGYTALDGTWSHDNGSDEWDGTGIGAGRPGGASALGGYLRVQDTGNPANHGMGDPGSNRKVYFGHSITNEPGMDPDVADTILDDGVTISFRARVATGGSLDPMYPGTGSDGENKDVASGGDPWPAGGQGYLGHDGGKGDFGVRQSSGDKIISFSLANVTAVLAETEGMKYNPTVRFNDATVGGQQGLVMNGLNGTAPSGSVDPWENEGALNQLPTDVTAWHEFWICIEKDPANVGTHRVTVWMDGDIVSNTVFTVTAGNGNDFADSYIGMGVGATGAMGAIDVDFFGYKPGVHAPVPEPATLALLGLGLGAMLIRRKR